jgi:Spy/CpxP family protein refolding chaperone
MNIKAVLLTTTGILTLALAASAAAPQDDSTWMGQRARGLVLRRVEHRLQITDSQRAQIRTVLHNEEPTIRSLAQRLQAENQQLTEQPGFDESYIRSVAAQNAVTQADVLVEREKLRNELLTVLTPAQRDTLQQMRKARRTLIQANISSFADQL